MEQVIETLAIEMENIGNEKGKHCQYRWKTLSMEKAMTWDSYHIHQYQQSDQTLRVQGRGGRKLPWRRLSQSTQVRDIITNEQVFSLLLITYQNQPAMTM